MAVTEDGKAYATELDVGELREIASLLSDAVRYNSMWGDGTRFDRAVTLANWFDGMANAVVEAKKGK